MKILITTDIEGVAGVVSFEDHGSPSGRYHERAKSLLTAEVNAAVEGMLERSVEDMLVMDLHGPGGITFEEVHEAAKVMHGRPLAPLSVRMSLMQEYDTAVNIGQHAMAGVVDGNLNHTQSSRTIDYISLNGRPIGETAQFALLVGSMGIPMIFLSGDEAACREVEALIPGITTVATKRGLSRSSAVSLSAVQSRKRIREGIIAAIDKQKTNPVAPLVWEGPYVLEKRFFHTETADRYMDADDVERVDSQTVRIRSDDIRKLIYR